MTDHSHAPASDPPPYEPGPANDPALQDTSLHSSQPVFVATYLTFGQDDEERTLQGGKASGRPPKNSATMWSVISVIMTLLVLLILALSTRRVMNSNPSDPDGRRHGRGGYGV